MSRNTDNIFDSKNGLAQMIVLVGRSGRGKSHLMRYLLTDMFSRGKLKFGLVFTKTKYNNDYDFLPSNRVIEGFDEGKLETYFNNLKKIKESKKKVPPNFIIFDDLQGVLTNQTRFMINFLATHRHLNITVFTAVQYLGSSNSVNPLAREQTSLAILFQSRTRRTLENIYNAWGGLFPTFDEFKDHFLTATQEKYTAMVYSEHVDNIEDNYISIQAPADFPKIEFKF